MSDSVREAFDSIESEVAQGAMTAAQVFTQMKQLVQTALSANGGEGSRKLSVLAAQLHESARCLGVAQAKEDADAKEYWGQISEAKLEAISTHPAPPSVAVPDDVTAAPSPDHSGDANKMVADHIPGAGKVVPIGYLTNQAVARLQSDKRLNGEHLYAFKPDDLSKFQAVCLAPTVNESLTIEDFNGMCRIVEAVSQMTDGFAIDQCHIDRAREIVQDATRLRTAGDEGEG